MCAISAKVLRRHAVSAQTTATVALTFAAGVAVFGLAGQSWAEPLPEPPAPYNVRATLLPAQSAARVQWDADDDRQAVGYVVQRYDHGWPGDVADPPRRNADEEHEEWVQLGAQEINQGGLKFRVCAVGTETATCSKSVSAKRLMTPDDKTISELTDRSSARDALTTRDGTDALQDPNTDFTHVTKPKSGNSHACANGYVWRLARAGDLVCVAPPKHKRVARENTEGPNHVDPDGAYGPQSCVPGYVWRNAFDGDLVCVTPDARDLAERENVEGKLHRGGANDANDATDATGTRDDFQVIH